MRIPIYQVDAFTSTVFQGNPAAVCPLAEWLDDELMQAIAMENNLSETAFVVRRDDESFGLRWFTPTTEVDLCGHATLATAHVLVHCLGEKADPLVFETRSGTLKVGRHGHRLVLDFPSLPATAEGMSPEERQRVVQAMGETGGEVRELLLARESKEQGNYLVVYGSEAEVLALRPDMVELQNFGRAGFIATAPGRENSKYDFVSRYFAPAFGVPEDPVTGSAHCTLTPYWVRRLGRTDGESLLACQVSRRSGELSVQQIGARVHIEGEAVLYLEGHLYRGGESG